MDSSNSQDIHLNRLSEIRGPHLIFHLLDVASGDAEPGPVSLAAISRAAAWADYLETHARRIYDLALNADARVANALLNKIKAGKVQEPFCARDIYRNQWSTLRTADDVKPALELLEAHDWVQRKPIDGNMRYLINPRNRGGLDMSSRWLQKLPKTHRYPTDKTDKPVSVSNVSTRPAHIQKKAGVHLGEMYEAVHDRIAANYLSGTWTWLREHQPELLAKINRLGDEWGGIWYRHQYENEPVNISTFEAALAQREAAWEEARRLCLSPTESLPVNKS